MRREALLRAVGIWLVSGALLLGACSEYSFDDPPDPWGQGNPLPLEGRTQVDRIRQLVVPTVDVLWVVDNSCSMQDEREALASHFPKFISYFVDSGADYHIGVISTDMSGAPHGGRLHERRGVRWITPETPDPIGVFTEMTVDMPGSLWSGTEMGRSAAYTALEVLGDEFNAGFLRDDPDAYLHITVISDEDDASGKPPIGKRGFINWMNDVRRLPHRTTWNSIVTLAPENAEESRGESYLELTDELGGAVWDINSARWEEILDDLGGLQAPKPTYEFFLSQLPVVDTLDVMIVHDGITQVFEQSVDYGFDQSRNSIWFLEYLPPEGSEVVITYQTASD